METDARHDAAVADIAERVRAFRDAGRSPRIVHGSTNSTRPRQVGDTIDVGHLDRVLHVDAQGMRAVVEPNVPMDALVDATLEHGLVPPVVMEFPGITVGGGIQGGAGESSSFRYGAFHGTFSAYEMVPADGAVVEVGPDAEPDLFHGTACSYGSLGILTAAELDLVPATDHVRLTYHRVGGAAEAVGMVREFARRDDIDFLDGILFGPDHGVVMTGVRSDADGLPVNRFHRARDDWFHRHARKAVDRRETWTENVPLRDYLFRYDRGAFWTGELAFDHLPFGPSREARTLLDPFFRTRRMYRFLHAGNIASRYIVQDICLPEERALDFIAWVDAELDITPLWLCPLAPDAHGSPVSPGAIDTDLIINVGVWGDPAMDIVDANRALEETVLGLDGRKVLYAHQYYPEDEFWQMYDWDGYRELRERYDAAGLFPDVYETTHVDAVPRPSIEGVMAELPAVLQDALHR